MDSFAIRKYATRTKAQHRRVHRALTSCRYALQQPCLFLPSLVSLSIFPISPSKYPTPSHSWKNSGRCYQCSRARALQHQESMIVLLAGGASLQQNILPDTCACLVHEPTFTTTLLLLNPPKWEGLALAGLDRSNYAAWHLHHRLQPSPQEPARHGTKTMANRSPDVAFSLR